MHDPVDDIAFEVIPTPPNTGPGSGKAVWIAFAERVAKANIAGHDLLEKQGRVIAAMQAEIELLRNRIAERRPPGGRAPTPVGTVERIEQEIAAGGSDRAIAKRYRVSHMTVHRIRTRMRQREAIVAAAGGASR